MIKSGGGSSVEKDTQSKKTPVFGGNRDKKNPARS